MSESRNGGMGFVGGLQLLFIGLKLAKVITWTWPVVFLPFEICGGIIAIVLLVMLGAVYVNHRRAVKRRKANIKMRQEREAKVIAANKALRAKELDQ